MGCARVGKIVPFREAMCRGREGGAERKITRAGAVVKLVGRRGNRSDFLVPQQFLSHGRPLSLICGGGGGEKKGKTVGWP